MKRIVSLIFVAFLATPAAGQELTIRHFAGSTGGAGTEDGPVARARLDWPGGIAVDAAGNTYFADSGNHTIRKITAAGVVTTLAGLAGHTGSADGRGSSAQFKGPRGIAVDGAGNVWVADTDNYTIRRIGPTGVVTTVAGMAGAAGSADGTGSAARFHYPTALAVEASGSVLVVELIHGHIRRVTAEGVVTTLSDSMGSAFYFSEPGGVAADAAGNVYVAQGRFVWKVTATLMTTIAGGGWECETVDGTGTDARFCGATGIVSDSAGNLWVTDAAHHVIRSITPAGVVTTLAGLPQVPGFEDGTGAAARFDGPVAVARRTDGTLVVADKYNLALRKVAPGGIVTTLVGGPTMPGASNGAGALARFRNPEGVAFDAAGNGYVADTGNSTIRKVTPAGAVTTLAGAPGLSGDDDGVGGAARFRSPASIAVDAGGNLFVADRQSHTVRRITAEGAVTTVAGSAGEAGSNDGTGGEARFAGPTGIAVDGAGNLYVADAGNHTIRKVAAGGVVTTLAGQASAWGSEDGTGPAARFYDPRSVAVDAVGSVLVADSGNGTIRRVSPAGVVTTVAGSATSRGCRDGIAAAASFEKPIGVAVDAAGVAWVLDSSCFEVRRVTPEGVVTTSAGLRADTNYFGSWPDMADGTGNAARFAVPTGIAAGPGGRVAVTDFHVLRLGLPALPDVATIDAVAGPVGSVRQLDTTPQTATLWRWEAVRLEGGSASAPSPVTARNPSFNPDLDGHFVLRLTASDGSRSRISTVSLDAGTVLPTALVWGPPGICPGGTSQIRTDLTGTPPWSLAWSDGFVQNGVAESPATRLVSPATSTAYTLTSVANVYGQGSVSGEAYVEVFVPPTAAVSGGGSVCLGRPAKVQVALSGSAPFTLQWSDGVTETGITSNRHERSVVPTGVTTYTLTSIADRRCNGTASGSATFTPWPVTTATVSGSTTICAGQQVELRADLTGTGPWRVTWSDGFVDDGVAASPSSHVVAPGATTTYTVTSVVDAKCTNGGTGAATVTVLAGPAPSVAITAPSPVAPGTAGLSASVPGAGPGATYAWTISSGAIEAGQGSAAITFSVGAPGQSVLGVTVSVPGGCAASGVTSVWVGANPSTPLYFSRLAGPTGGGGWFDGPGATARLYYPAGVAVDSAGNTYIVDLVNNSVRKRTPDGRVSTLAGLAGSYGGSDGQGSRARFRFPAAIAATAGGVVYVADTQNHTIRKIGPTGIVSTLAGQAGYMGIEDGTGSNARFYSPDGLAFDGAGNLFVADSGSHLIRRVTPDGVVTTIAGRPYSPGREDGDVSTARFREPAGLALDAGGNLYVADNGNHRIRRISQAGLVTTIAGASAGWADGTGPAAAFRSPTGIAVDGTGSLFVADSGNSVVRRISPSGQVTTPAGLALARGDADGTGSDARFNGPTGVAIGTSGELVIADRENDAIRVMTPAGAVTTVAGRASNPGGVDGIAAGARFRYPVDVAVESSGSLVVADSSNGAIRRIAPSGEVTTLAGLLGQLGSVDGTGSAARFLDPAGIAVAADGDIFVSDDFDHTLRKVSSAGVVTTVAGYSGDEGSRDGTGRAARFFEPWGVATDVAGYVYVADSRNQTIRKISPIGAVTTLAGLAGGEGSSDGTGTGARFRNPAGLAVDRAGNVFVADRGNATIRRITPAGEVTTLAGLAGWGGSEDGPGSVARFSSPTGLRIDGAGNLWVTDSAALRKVSPEGHVTTVGGAIGAAYGAANGTGSAAQLGAPYGVAILPSGEIALADAQNHSIWIGVPSLLDEAEIDSAIGSVGATRQLDAKPRSATSWLWELVRTESASNASLSSTTIPNPTFTPDVPGTYRFRLTASDGVKKSITLVSLFVSLPGPTAAVSGGATVCPGELVQVLVELGGVAPWAIVWSDGVAWTGITHDQANRNVHPAVSTTLTVVSVADATGPGTASGSAVIVVLPKTPTPVVQAPAQVGTGSPNQRASVPANAGSTYSWWVTNGTITTGWNTNEIVFTAGTAGTMTVNVRETKVGQCPSETASATVEVLPSPVATLFYPVSPCRVLDTRASSGPTGGQPVAAGGSLGVGVGGVCGIPWTARALVGNVTVTQPADGGYLVVYPADREKPLTSTVHFAPGRTRAASTQAKVSTDGYAGIAISNESPGVAHVILDVSGYFQ